MVQQIASDPQVQLPISAIGGISGWRDAAEFILLGCGTLQACTAAMHYGFRVVEDMIDGLSHWMDSKGYANLDAFRGLSSHESPTGSISISTTRSSPASPDTCIGCQLCYTACWDGAHQCIHVEARWPKAPPPSSLLPQPDRLPRHTRSNAFPKSTNTNASAAISAGSFVPLKTASAWFASTKATIPKAGPKE